MTTHELNLRTDDIDPNDQSDLERLADRCDEQIEWLSEKITSGRIRDLEKFEARLKGCRALSTMIRTRLKVEEEKELDRMAAEIEELEAVLERQ